MQRIAPCVMFVGDQYGTAEEAMRLHVSLFRNRRMRCGGRPARPAPEAPYGAGWLAKNSYIAAVSSGPAASE
jgi:hypothetical protein